MNDFLGYVERNYGCVAEYQRCRAEEDDYYWEQKAKRYEYYRKNKELLDKAEADGTLVYFSYECKDCPDYTDIGMTSDQDDVDHGICGNLDCKDCPYRCKD